ncbi:MAG: hypothetical protein PUA86_06550 [Clostridiaceae bacterium]|nr:hypothetical protein [Clostridiaceae bacterium]
MSEFLEACMVVSFGISWPMNIIKSLRTRSAKGKSLPFLLFIFAGYICGITSKLISGNITYVFVFYVLNLLMVGTDIVLYFRNRRLDAQRAAAGERV